MRRAFCGTRGNHDEKWGFNKQRDNQMELDRAKKKNTFWINKGIILYIKFEKNLSSDMRTNERTSRTTVHSFSTWCEIIHNWGENRLTIRWRDFVLPLSLVISGCCLPMWGMCSIFQWLCVYRSKFILFLLASIPSPNSFCVLRKPWDVTVNGPTNKPDHEPTNKPTPQPSNKTSQSTNRYSFRSESINKSTTHSVSQSLMNRANSSIDHSFQQRLSCLVHHNQPKSITVNNNKQYQHEGSHKTSINHLWHKTWTIMNR